MLFLILITSTVHAAPGYRNKPTSARPSVHGTLPTANTQKNVTQYARAADVMPALAVTLSQIVNTEPGAEPNMEPDTDVGTPPKTTSAEPVDDTPEIASEPVLPEIQFTEEELNEIISNLQQIYDAKKKDIDNLDAEIARCRSNKRVNAVSIAIGAAGVLGSGITAFIQNQQIKNATSQNSENQDAQ